MDIYILFCGTKTPRLGPKMRQPCAGSRQWLLPSLRSTPTCRARSLGSTTSSRALPPPPRPPPPSHRRPNHSLRANLSLSTNRSTSLFISLTTNHSTNLSTSPTSSLALPQWRTCWLTVALVRRAPVWRMFCADVAYVKAKDSRLINYLTGGKAAGKKFRSSDWSIYVMLHN